MYSRIGVVPRHFIAAAFALCLFATYATAQVAIQPKDEVFGGYSWLGISGTADFGVKTPSISGGFDASTTYYLPQAHNLGLIADGSGHLNRANNFVGVGFGMFGVQYKYHTSSFSPFVRAMVGFANLSPAYPPTSPNGNNEWQAALSAGGGFDYTINHRFSIRVAQADYIYTNYDIYCSGVQNFVCIPSHESSQWNNIRLATGVVVNLGNYYEPPVAAACTATPATVMEGEPVTVSASPSNFNPKHTLTYGWTVNGGGKLDSSDKQSAKIDTTGMAGGSYVANATVTDPKGPKKANVANCGANFSVSERPKNPPQVTCSANPTTVKSGDMSTITASATSPDAGITISSYAYTSTGGKISGSGTTATLDTTGTSSGPINVTVTATDSRGLTGSCTAMVTVENPPTPPTCSKINSIAFPDLKRPWRVDNTAKAILDDVATRLKADPTAKIVVIGYADGEKAPMIGTGKKRHAMDLAGQRAVNAKAYLVQQQGIDPSRVEVRQGVGQQKVADIVWVPQGADENACTDLQNTTPVDESIVKPNQTVWPRGTGAAPPRRHHKKAAPASAPAQ